MLMEEGPVDLTSLPSNTLSNSPIVQPTTILHNTTNESQNLSIPVALLPSHLPYHNVSKLSDKRSASEDTSSRDESNFNSASDSISSTISFEYPSALLQTYHPQTHLLFQVQQSQVQIAPNDPGPSNYLPYLHTVHPNSVLYTQFPDRTKSDESDVKEATDPINNSSKHLLEVQVDVNGSNEQFNTSDIPILSQTTFDNPTSEKEDLSAVSDSSISGSISMLPAHADRAAYASTYSQSITSPSSVLDSSSALNEYARVIGGLPLLNTPLSPFKAENSILPNDSYAHSTDTTTIDGVVYNSRGYEVCGYLNQHNKPCQRIGRCPFHAHLFVKKDNVNQKGDAGDSSVSSSSSSPTHSRDASPVGFAVSSAISAFTSQPTLQSQVRQESEEDFNTQQSITLTKTPSQVLSNGVNNPSNTITLGIDSITLNYVPPAPSIPKPPPPPPVPYFSTSPTILSKNTKKKEEKLTTSLKKVPFKQGWTKEEHLLFLQGLQIYGKGAWKEISSLIKTRNPTQIQSHAQKYFLRQKQQNKNKRSIHDVTLQDCPEFSVEETSARTNPRKSPKRVPISRSTSSPTLPSLASGTTSNATPNANQVVNLYVSYTVPPSSQTSSAPVSSYSSQSSTIDTQKSTGTQSPQLIPIAYAYFPHMDAAMYSSQPISVLTTENPTGQTLSHDSLESSSLSGHTFRPAVVTAASEVRQIQPIVPQPIQTANANLVKQSDKHITPSEKGNLQGMTFVSQTNAPVVEVTPNILVPPLQDPAVTSTNFSIPLNHYPSWYNVPNSSQPNHLGVLTPSRYQGGLTLTTDQSGRFFTDFKEALSDSPKEYFNIHESGKELTQQAVLIVTNRPSDINVTSSDAATVTTDAHSLFHFGDILNTGYQSAEEEDDLIDSPILPLHHQLLVEEVDDGIGNGIDHSNRLSDEEGAEMEANSYFNTDDD